MKKKIVKTVITRIVPNKFGTPKKAKIHVDGEVSVDEVFASDFPLLHHMGYTLGEVQDFINIRYSVEHLYNDGSAE